MKQTIVLICLLVSQLVSSQEVPKLYKFADTPPVYEGCQDLNDRNANLRCFEGSLKKHLSDNLNYNILDETELASGKNKFKWKFEIGTDGSLTFVYLKGPNRDVSYPLIEEELKRILAIVPKIQSPALNNGKAIKTIYVDYITFVID